MSNPAADDAGVRNSRSRGSVAAVIVTFEPVGERLVRVLDSVTAQVDHVIVVDNGSSPATLEWLRRETCDRDLECVELGRNAGIAAAHNVGIRRALERGDDFVLLLDHDSVLAPTCVRHLRQEHERLTSSAIRVGAVGPTFVNETTRLDAPFVRIDRWRVQKVYAGPSDPSVESDLLISSGTLISAEVVRDVGFMNEALFIDGVDWEWCFRARALGYRMFGVGGAHMLHSLGDAGLAVLHWRLPLHSPRRNYYSFRNTVSLCKKDGVPLSWKVDTAARLGARVPILLALAPERATRLRLIVRGVVDGLLGRGGPL